MSDVCPSTEELSAALRRPQSPDVDRELAAHLSECEKCRARLEDLAGGSGWLVNRARAHAGNKAEMPAALRTAIHALESKSSAVDVDPPLAHQLDFLTPSDQPGLLGVFGSYEVLAHIASGGMGIVLKARDPGLNRIVALKILPPALAASSLARSRFIREARAAAAVVHEHVVAIHAVDECAGLPYLVMQFISGETLAERIRLKGALPLVEILRIGSQTASGLAAAHAQGLIHRDVKPGNIMLEDSVERVKIADFGLARAADDSSLTRDGHVAGTPEYMSPEQANCASVDQRADLFGFGCVLYEMATGVSPFRADKPLVALRRVCEESPPLAHVLNPRMPEWLGQLIGRLMAKDPANRPHTALEVEEELKRQLAALQQGVEVGRTASSHRAPLILPFWLGLLVISGLIGFITFLVLKANPNVQEGSTAASTVSGTSSAAVSSPPGTSLFLLPASAGQPERGFASLGEAVESAAPGAVIECRFNGVQSTPTLHLENKPLVLRAAPGFEPVLTSTPPGAPLLHTRAALVVEGLTVVAQPSLATDGRSGQLRTSIVMNGAESPLLTAHCRFALHYDGMPSYRPRPSIVRLSNVPLAVFLNCEFVARGGFAIALQANYALEDKLATHELTVQGCTVFGDFLSRDEPPVVRNRLNLIGNTFCGDAMITMARVVPDVPIQVDASHNVLAPSQLLLFRPPRADSYLLETLLRWKGSSNVYDGETLFSDPSTHVVGHNAWLVSPATDDTASVIAKLELRKRLEGPANSSRLTESAAFGLTPEERQQIAAQLGVFPENLGADAAHNGPGKACDEWRASPAYQDWQALVREHLPELAAEK